MLLHEELFPLSNCYFGGGKGFCLKLKQSDMSSEAASLLFRGFFNPNVTSQNFTRLTCEWNALEIPRLEYGLITRHPTRVP